MKSRICVVALAALFTLAGVSPAHATIPPRQGVKWPKSYEDRRALAPASRPTEMAMARSMPPTMPSGMPISAKRLAADRPPAAPFLNLPPRYCCCLQRKSKSDGDAP